MRRLNEFVTEDTNQFGPGTDLTISLVAVLMVMVLITSHLYQIQRRKSQDQQRQLATYQKKEEAIAKDAKEGHFKLANAFFPAGDFEVRPVTQLTNPEQTRLKIERIIEEYHANAGEFSFIFVIGHSNQIDDPNAVDKSYGARLQRNWEYAGRRAALIADLLQAGLTTQQRERIVVMTTGEFDLKIPSDPNSQENAWVEVVFGKEWKPPSASLRPAY
jgi:hypothetical protein